MRASQYFNDFTFRIEMPLRPVQKFNDHLIVQFWNWFYAAVCRFRYQNILNDPRIIRDYVVGVATFLQRPGNRLTGARQNSNDAGLWHFVGFRGTTLLTFFQMFTLRLADNACQYLVKMQSYPGVLSSYGVT